MKKKSVSFVKTLGLFLLIFSSIFVTYAHSGVEHETQAEAYAHYSSFEKVLPFMYFDQGNYFAGILVIIFWIGLLAGLYNLIIMVLGRAIHIKENK